MAVSARFASAECSPYSVGPYFIQFLRNTYAECTLYLYTKYSSACCSISIPNVLSLLTFVDQVLVDQRLN